MSRQRRVERRRTGRQGGDRDSACAGGMRGRLRCWVLWMLGRKDSRRDPLGAQGERAAAKLLKRAGYRVIGRNVRVRMGEADLVCLAPDRRTIVVVEVKSRRIGETQPGHVQPAPEMSVHAEKRRKLRAIARHLGRANGWTRRPLRIDVVAVEWTEETAGARARAVLRHHEGVERVW